MVEFQWISANSRLLIKSLVLLWIIAVAIECGDLTKRDVVHRIVLKAGKRPKAHKHHHHYHSYRTNGNRGSKIHKYKDHIEVDKSTYDSPEDSWESRRNKRPDDSREKKSKELTRENSRENSFEDSYESIRSKKERPLRQNYHRFHEFSEDINAEESRLPEPSKIRHIVEDNWATTLDDVPPVPEINPKKKIKKFKASTIDFTTSFPVKPPPSSFQFSPYEPLYPALPTLPNLALFPSTFEYNKKPEYGEPQPLPFNPQLPVLQPKPVNQFTNLLPIPSTVPFKPNLSNNYEVNEKGIIDVQSNTFLMGTKDLQKIVPVSFQKPGTARPTNTSAVTSANAFKNDIKNHPPTRSSKKKFRINSSI